MVFNNKGIIITGLMVNGKLFIKISRIKLQTHGNALTFINQKVVQCPQGLKHTSVDGK